MKELKIGCCGFPVSRKKYIDVFNIVELQNTFYNLPSKEWARKIRSEVPDSFEFTIKAWQVITHPSRSPTWRRLKDRPPGNLENYGWLKPTPENIDAMKKILEIAEALKSKIIILQTPPSMPFTDESIRWVKQFFEVVESIKDDKMIGWEPRGAWSRDRRVLEEIMCRYNVIHVVDVFKAKPVCIPNGTLYVRLHGLNGEINYRYKYSDKDLEKLVEILDSIDFKVGYILFNNIHMFDDASRFKKIAYERGFKTI